MEVQAVADLGLPKQHRNVEEELDQGEQDDKLAGEG